MQRNDLIRIRHMWESVAEIVKFMENKSKKDLRNNRMLMLSIIKLIEIIGEAASKITKDTRDELPQIPWPVIIGMRNRLIHVYFDVELEMIWKTITEDLPPLMLELEKIIAAEGG